MADDHKTKEATKGDLDNLSKKFDDHYSDRMDRIEKKLDALTSAVVSIARAEEKIAVLIEDTQEIKAAVNSHTNRIHELEIDVEQNKNGLRNLGKFIWTFIGAGSTIIVAMIMGQMGL